MRTDNSPPRSPGTARSQLGISTKFVHSVAKLFTRRTAKDYSSASANSTTCHSNNTLYYDPTIEGLSSLPPVEQQILKETDNLLNEFDVFSKKATETIDFSQKTILKQHSKYNPLLMSKKINKWRAKQKGNALFNHFDNLMTRSEDVQKNLKILAERSLNDSSPLVTQALKMKQKLMACIEFNSIEVSKLRPFMNAASDFLEELRDSSQDIIEMMDFLDEVRLMKETQPEPYIEWGAQPSSIESIPFPRKRLEERLSIINKVNFLTNWCF